MQLLRLLAQVPGSPLESVPSTGLRAVGISSYPGGTPASKLPSESQKTPAARCRRISFLHSSPQMSALLGREAGDCVK